MDVLTFSPLIIYNVYMRYEFRVNFLCKIEAVTCITAWSIIEKKLYFNNLAYKMSNFLRYLIDKQEEMLAKTVCFCSTSTIKLKNY